MSIPGRFGLSALGDYVNRRYVMAACLATMAIAFVLMGRADSIDGVIPALLAYAVAQGGVAVIPQSLVALSCQTLAKVNEEPHPAPQEPPDLSPWCR